MGDKVKPPKLPSGAPKELKNFLACKILEVDLDPANATWLPKPELVPDGVDATITPTATGANALSVTVGWGFVSITLPVSLSNGELQVDAGNMPGSGAVNDWVKSFNDSLKSNGKELSGLEIKNGKIHLTKRVIGAAAETTTPATAVTTPTPVVPPATTPPTTTPPTTPPSTTPPPPPAEGESAGTPLKPGCLIGIILALVLIIGVGLVMFFGDDSNSTSDSKATTSSRASTTTLAPIDETLICARLEVLQAVLDDFGVDDPCEIDPDDFWDACEDFMPCFTGRVPLIALNRIVGITHNGSEPDAATGQMGPSQSEHRAQVVGPAYDTNGLLQAISQCGGNTLTGQSTLMPTGVTSVKHPLLSFGNCRADVYYQGSSVRQLIGSYDYTVSDAAIAASDPVTEGITVPAETSLNAAGTTLGLLGGKALDPACTWYTANSTSLSIANCLNDRWVFNAAYSDPRIVSYGAGFINPLGIPAPTEEQMAPFGASRLFGPGTLFPCGPGHFGYTACAKNEAKVETSAFVGGTVSFTRQLGEIPVDTFVEVGVEEYWVRLTREADSWTLTSSEGDDSQSRAILRGNAVTFMIPYDEGAAPDLAYTVTVGDSTGEVAQPAQPVLGMVTSTQGPETPSDFFQQLSNSIATGDLSHALNRLHPLVYEAFPGEACRAELSMRVTPDYKIALQSVGETASWTWELPDGRSYEVAEATTVSIILPGSPDPVDAHVVNIDRMYYWFTICDGR